MNRCVRGWCIYCSQRFSTKGPKGRCWLAALVYLCLWLQRLHFFERKIEFLELSIHPLLLEIFEPCSLTSQELLLRKAPVVLASSCKFCKRGRGLKNSVRETSVPIVCFCHFDFLLLSSFFQVRFGRYRNSYLPSYRHMALMREWLLRCHWCQALISFEELKDLLLWNLVFSIFT